MGKKRPETQGSRLKRGKTNQTNGSVSELAIIAFRIMSFESYFFRISSTRIALSIRIVKK